MSSECVSFQCTAKGLEALPPAARAILGDYVAEGHNHGRRIYRRKAAIWGGKRRPEVVLFFWDARDGKALAGWWLGDKVGGGRVWAKNPDTGRFPPKMGWRCPVNGPPQKDILCIETATVEDGGEVNDDILFEASSQVIRPGSSQLSSQANKQQPTKPDVLVLSSTLAQAELSSLRIVFGEYVQQGKNHGKSTYVKHGSADDKAEDPTVWLYYWDGRDGPEFSGWWLGRSVGGNEVYGRAMSHSALPATKGWRIPHEGDERKDVTLLPKAEAEEAMMDGQERLKLAIELVVKESPLSSKVVKLAQTVLNGDGELFEESVQAVHEQLQARMAALTAAGKSIARHIVASKRQPSAASAELEIKLKAQESQLDAIKDKVATEFRRSSALVNKAETEHTEERDAKVLEEMLPNALEQVTEAELKVVESGSMEVTDILVARGLLSKARRTVERALITAKGFAPKAQAIATAEFTSLSDRCRAVDKKLQDREAADMGEDRDDLDVDMVGIGMHFLGEEGLAGARLQGDGGRKRTANDLAGGSAEVMQAIHANSSASNALEAANVALAGPSGFGESAKMRCDLLQRRDAELRSAQKSLAAASAVAARRGDATSSLSRSSPLNPEALNLLIAKVKSVQSKIASALAGAKAEAARAEQSDKQSSESLDSASQVLELVDKAEIATDALSLEVGDADWWRIQMESQSGRKAQQVAIRAQQTADTADALLAEARNRLESQVRAATRLLAGEKQQAYMAEIAPVRARLAQVQEKLSPLREVRSMYEQHLQAKAQLEDFARRVDEAKHIAEKERGFVAGEVRAAQLDLMAIIKSLGRNMNIDDPESSVGVALTQRRQELRTAASEALGLFANLKAKIDQKKQQAQGEALLEKARLVVEDVEQWRPRLEAAQKPWTNGVETSVSSSMFDAADAMVASAERAVAATLKLLSENLSEAKSLPDAFGASEGLEVLRARVEAVATHAAGVKTDTATRRVKAQMPRAVEAMALCDGRMRQVVEAAAALAQDNIESPMPKELPGICRRILELEKKASAECAVAQKALGARPANSKDLKGAEAMVSKLVARVTGAASQLARLKQAAQDAEGNFKTFSAKKAELERLEKQVAEAEILNLPLGDETHTSEETEDARATAAQKASQALLSWRSAAEPFADHPHGAMKLGMERLLKRSSSAKQRLDDIQVHKKKLRVMQN